MDISRDTAAVREFARRHELDIKYLVDGANFVISRMHFNPEENFYITLGLPMNATPEEIRQRWKKLMLLYHPDRQAGDEEWVSERAKKVNEAYSTLKDDARRLEYDRRLAEPARGMRRPYPAQHAEEPRGANVPRRFPSRLTRATGESSAGDQFRKHLPKVLIGFYVLAAAVFLLYIYQQNRSSTLESELRAQSPGPQIMQQESAAAHPADPDAVPAPPGEGKISARSSLSIARPSPPGASRDHGLAGTAPGVREAGDYHAPAVKPEGAAEKKGAVQSAVAAPEPAAAREKKKQAPVPEPAAQERPQRERAPDEQKLPSPISTAVRPEQPAQPSIADITREEVDAFMQRYIRTYTQNDLEGFMALFSSAAIENNTMRYHDIRIAYRETFREKIADYRLQNMDIRTDGQKATVSGTYSLSRYRSSEGRWVRYSGRITWRLARENSQLKIVSTNYDN